MPVKLLAFVDGSPYSASVCDHVAWAARRLDAVVEVFHVIGRRIRQPVPTDLSGNLRLGARTELLEKLSHADAEWAQLAQARGRVILDEARARIVAAGVETVETRLRIDDLVDTVHQFEETADLIVVGKRGEASGMAREHLGSNLERTLRGAHRPVLVANHEFGAINRVLLAFDGGPSARKALTHLAEGTLFRGLEIMLLEVNDSTPDTRARLEGAASLLREAGHTVSTEIRQGHAETVIPEAVRSEGIDLLIMGAYGHSRIRNLIIGSTTTAMARSCEVPLMMFR